MVRLMLSLLLGCSNRLKLIRELWSMHSNLKKLTIISTIGQWNSRLGTKFVYLPRIWDSLAPLNCSSIFLDNLKSWVRLEVLHTSCSWHGRSGVCTTVSMWVCCNYTYLVGPSRGPQILLLQQITRSMRSRKLLPIRRQEAGWSTKSNRERVWCHGG